MPMPTNKYSFDGIISYPLADYINTLTNCNLNPNMITILNFILTVLIINNIYYSKYQYLPYLFVLHAFLDVLDGATARKCNKKTELGHYLDIFNDFVFFNSLIFIFWFKLKISYFYLLLYYIIIICLFYTQNSVYISIYNMLHDNSVLLEPIVFTYIFCYYLK